MTLHEAPAKSQPPARRPRSLASRAFAVISSPQLAIALLIAVLVCCVVGVTVFTGERAWAMIFNTPWFNGLLVLLSASSGLTFFGRIWGRKLTVISVGMIVFHISFMSLLFGVVFNSLLHFNGVLRLTEGETLPNGDPASYDFIDAGRFFEISRLRGETTLIKMNTGYKVEGLDKRAAYEIRVGDGSTKTTGTIYMTQNLEHDGVRYLVSKEGYSIGVVLHEKKGPELYAAMVPLQSLPRGKGAFLYTTGTATEPLAFPFPPPPQNAAIILQVGYLPDPEQERGGQVEFFAWPTREAGADHVGPQAKDHGVAGSAAGPDLVARVRSGKVAIGGKFDAGDYLLEAGEVRYWVGMSVRYDPGLLFILSSLWAGLGGMTMTFVGRIWQDSKREKREAIQRGSRRPQPGTDPPKENP